jgi:hypothetical protein
MDYLTAACASCDGIAASAIPQRDNAGCTHGEDFPFLFEFLLIAFCGAGALTGSFGVCDGAGTGCGTAGFGIASGISIGCEPG